MDEQPEKPARKLPAHLWKKGESGNPSGRKKLPNDIREAKTMDKIQFARILHKFVHMRKDQLSDSLRNPNATMLELMVGHIVAKAAKDGDTVRATFLLDRMIGKVADQVDVSNMVHQIVLNYKK